MDKQDSDSRGFATVLILLAVVLVSVSIVGTFYLSNNSFLQNFLNKPSVSVPAPTLTPTPQVKEVKLQGTVALKEGTVELQKAPGIWEDIKKGADIKEGDVLKTGYKSRVVIVLDDGSAVRLDQGTEVAFSTLSGEVIMLDQKNGRVYHRVNPGRLVYNVRSFNTVATALGTSFSVASDAKTESTEVAVFESKVAVTTGDQQTAKTEVEKGEVATVSKENEVKLADLTTAQTKGEFIAWNQTLDQQPAPTSKLTTPPEPTKISVPTHVPAASTDSELSVAAEARPGGAIVEWTGDSPNGFKVCYSESVNPTYPGSNCTFKNATERRHEINGLSGGKTYHVRVGIYGWDGKVNTYSDDVTVTPTSTSSSSESNASLSLTVTSNDSGKVNMSWTLNGSEANGFKTVWAEHENPVYPDDHWHYLGTSSRGDEFTELPSGQILHFRVGIYGFDGKVTTYSNNVTVTVK